MIQWRIRHVVDHDIQIRVLLDPRHDIGQPGYGSQDGHRHPELGAASPQRGHQRTSNPVAARGSRGADTNAMESLLFRQPAQMIGRGWVFGIDPAYTAKILRIALQY